MTKEEILAMEAGNQLNAEVASQIMDIKVEYPFGEGFPYYLKEDDRWRKDVPWAEQGKMKWAPILPYSTDISAAGQIVEKDGAWDIKKRYRPHPEDPPGSPGRPTYQAAVQISDYDPYEDELFNKWSGRSPWCWTLPEAICKAALIAKLEAG